MQCTKQGYGSTLPLQLCEVLKYPYLCIKLYIILDSINSFFTIEKKIKIYDNTQRSKKDRSIL